MKIIFVIGSLGSGGAERVVSVLANRFNKLGHQVNIITLAKDICIYPLNEGVQHLHIDTDIKLKGLSGLQKVYRLKECIKQLNSDIVISFTAGVSIYVLLARILLPFKIIVSERNDPNLDPKSKVLRKVRNILYNLSDGFVFQTPDAKDYFSKKVQGRSEVIGNPVKPNLPKPFLELRSKRIVATGRLEPQKNYPLLLETFAKFREKYPDYSLDIYGEGALKEQLEQMSYDLDIAQSVKFKGVVDNWHEKSLDASMYILSSEYEGMPNALMEAMAIGLPCISTNCPCGGPSLLIQHEKNGLLTPVNDKNSLLNCMYYIASNQDKARVMGRYAAEEMENYSVQNISKLWLEFSRRIVGN